MKYNHLLVLFFCCFCIVGCKDTTTDKSEGTTVEQKAEEPFTATLKFVAKKSDDFCMLYTEDGTINFGEKGVWKAIEGSENEQEVTFVLPADEYPTQLRFDLGMKKDQEDIIVKGIKLLYRGKTFEAYGSKFWSFFRADENQCTADVNTGLVKAVVKDGERKNASLYPQSTLRQEIENLAK